MIAVAIGLIAWLVPSDGPLASSAPASSGGYAAVLRQRTFLRFAPLGVFHYGGMIAIQSLWAGPWLNQVCEWTPEQAANGLFAINLGMLCTFMAWGGVVPRLYLCQWLDGSKSGRVGCTRKPDRADLRRGHGARRDSVDLAAVLHHQYMRFAVATRRGPGSQHCTGGSRTVSVQPVRFCGCLLCAMGDRHGDRSLSFNRLDDLEFVSRRIHVVGCLLRPVVPVVSWF